MMKSEKKYNVDDAIDFISNGSESDLSGLSLDEEENNEIEDAVQNNVSDDESMLQNLVMTFLLLL